MTRDEHVASHACAGLGRRRLVAVFLLHCGVGGSVYYLWPPVVEGRSICGGGSQVQAHFGGFEVLGVVIGQLQR
jgi:hypothetical protein